MRNIGQLHGTIAAYQRNEAVLNPDVLIAERLQNPTKQDPM